MSILRTDMVVIKFRRVKGVRFISAFRIIGSAFPCRGFLFIGGRVLFFAQRCLLTNGFSLVFSSGNVLVFVRKR